MQHLINCKQGAPGNDFSHFSSSIFRRSSKSQVAASSLGINKKGREAGEKTCRFSSAVGIRVNSSGNTCLVNVRDCGKSVIFLSEASIVIAADLLLILDTRLTLAGPTLCPDRGS